MKRGARMHERRDEALERQVAREARSDAQQIALLESRGHGHCREVARLRKRTEGRAA